MTRPTPQQVRHHLLKHLYEQGPATITQLGYGLGSLGVTHGYDTAYRQAMNLKRDGLIASADTRMFVLTPQGRETFAAQIQAQEEE